MLQAIEARHLASMLRGAAAEVIAREALLSQLDSVTGDGDHGTTMRRAVQSLAGSLDDARDIAAMLACTGDLFLNSDGGASGGLLGALFLGMSQECAGKESLDCGELATAFDCGLAAVKRYTKAKAGDKTMLDALEPACTALRDAAGRGEPIETALRSAACAAAAGAAATKDMKARFGRAQYLGERTVGCQDPGATTIACIFEGFVNGIERHSEKADVDRSRDGH